MCHKVKNFLKSEKSQWFVPLLLKDIHLLVITVVLGVMSSLLGLSMAVFSQKLIDEIIPRNDIAYLIKGICIIAAILVVKLSLSYIQSYIGLLHGKKFNLGLIDSFFKKLLFLPKKFFDENKTGGLITRMHDSGAIHGTITFVVNTLLLNIINITISAIFLFHYSSTLGLIALSSFPIFLISAVLSKNAMKARVEAMYEANAENEGHYIASIQNSDLIKTHNKQDYFTKINYFTYRNLQEKVLLSSRAGLAFGITSESIGTFFYLMMLSFAAFQTISGLMTIGEFTATLGVATGILWPIGALGNSIMHLQSAQVAFDRMFQVVSTQREFLEDEEKNKRKLDDIQLIEFDNVHFSYDQSKEVLDGISFSVRRGEIVCIFGKNGAGKSTILNLIMALYKPHAGIVRFNNTDAKELSVVDLRNHIAIISQQTKLFEGPVIKNICLSDSEEEYHSSVNYLSELGFDEYISSINGGYAAKISESGNNLSGGQKQIISLARALNKRPDVLLVDEATASLDGDSENFVIEKLREFSAKGGIVVMVSHRLRPARAATKIIVLDNRSVSHVGTHDELMKTKNLYSKRFTEVVH